MKYVSNCLIKKLFIKKDNQTFSSSSTGLEVRT
jgi:hypothetical protein